MSEATPPMTNAEVRTARRSAKPAPGLLARCAAFIHSLDQFIFGLIILGIFVFMEAGGKPPSQTLTMLVGVAMGYFFKSKITPQAKP